jgi:hypothetical protein
VIGPAVPLDSCQAEGWTHNSEEVICDLPEGHGGKHVDRWMGWEW